MHPMLPHLMLLGMLVSTYSLAEETPTPLDTIVVSSDRTEAQTDDTASAISAVSQEDISTVNAEHINQLIFRTPGAWISRGNGQEHLTAIRSPVLTGAGACGAFLIEEDGIPTRASGLCNVNQLFDTHYEAAAQIEVFRGPNSALYGSNALFGGINVRLPSPGNPLSSNLRFDIAESGFFRASLRQSLSADQHSLFYALTTTKDEGYRDDSGYDQQKFTAKHNWRSNRLNITNGITYTHLNQETAGFILGKDAYKSKEQSHSNPNPEAFRDSRSLRLYSRWQWQFDNSELRITPYYRSNKMEFLMHFVPWQPVENNQQESFGSQLQWRTSLTPSVDAFIGADLEWSDGSLSEIQEDDAPFAQDRFPTGTHYDYQVDTRKFGIYSGLSWQASDTLKLELTSRFDQDNFDYKNLADDGSACAPDVDNCRFFRPIDQKNRFDALSTKLGAVFQYNQHHSLYASLSQSFRAPQASELYRLQQGQEFADLNPVKLNNIEIGFRGISGPIHYQISVFSMNKTDGIFLDSERQYVSGSDTSHQGIEYDFLWAPVDTLNFRLLGTYANHKYTNNPNLLGSNLFIKGNTIDTAPRTINSAMAQWSPIEKFKLELELIKMGSYFTNPANTNRYEGHLLTNLRSQFTLSSRVELSVSMTNILDIRYAERADIAFGTERYFPGQARKIMLSVAWKFN